MRVLVATVANRRQNICLELHSCDKFDAVTRGELRRPCSPRSPALLGHPEFNNPKGTFMKCASVVKAVAAVAAVVGLAACTDLKPLQAEVADLKSQLAKVQGDASSA